MNRLITPFVALGVALAVSISTEARADPYGVGLGVAGGVNIADADGDVDTNTDFDTRTSFAWGFFVDIPLIETFYITPAATLYELDRNGEDSVAITDIDLNFKFIVPIGALSLGVGVTAGLTTGLGDYQPHYGALAYVGFNLIANLDLFVMAQYKRLVTSQDNLPDYNNIHGFGGIMFRL